MNAAWQYGLGLTVHSTNDEIRDRVFQFVTELGTLMVATVTVDGKTPTIRALEVHRLDEEGNLYIGISHGKPGYQELRHDPHISAGATFLTCGKLGAGLRISAEVEEVEDEAIYARYWKQNPGTTKLYRKGPENFRIFRLKCGDGEIFDLCEDDKTLRFRFGFGGCDARPWRYTVNDSCVGCGLCAERCMKAVISVETGKAVIDHSGCLECGLCYEACPNGAITGS